MEFEAISELTVIIYHMFSISELLVQKTLRLQVSL